MGDRLGGCCDSEIATAPCVWTSWSLHHGSAARQLREHRGRARGSTDAGGADLEDARDSRERSGAAGSGVVPDAWRLMCVPVFVVAVCMF